MKDQTIELQSAQDPQTSEAALEFLAMYSGPEVRRAVAQHPNASLGALLSLALEFFDEVLQNPSFGARFLDSFGQISLSTHAKLIALMLRHPAVSVGLRRSLFAAIEQRNAKVLRAHMLESLLSDGQFNAEDCGLWSIVLAHTEFPEERLADFLCGAVPEHRWAASQHPRAPRPLIRTLISLGSSTDLKRYTPENIKPASPESLTASSRLGFWGQYLVAQHPALPEDLFLRLIESPFAPVRRAIAAHPMATLKVLRLLAKDNNSAVLAEVASHPMTPPEDLIRLYEKNPFSLKMKQSIAANPNTPDETLLRLAEQPDPAIWMALVSRTLPERALMRLLESTPKRQYERLNAIARSPGLTSKIGAILAKSKHVRPVLASNPYAPEDVLLTVGKDSSFEVRSALAQNWSTPPHVLKLLMRDKSEEVREFARVHPNQQPIQAATNQVLRLARELLTRFEEQSVTLDPVVQRALLTFEAIAPQGFNSTSAQTIFTSLSEALSAVKHPLAQYMLLLTQSLSKPSGVLPLWRLRAFAISCFALLGLDASEAVKTAEQQLCGT